MTGRVYSAIVAITEELSRSGVAKVRTNEEDRYRFRGIDDVCEALSPLLGKHRLCFLPRVLDRVATERKDVRGKLLMGVSVKMAFDLVCSEDGSRHIIESFGEALDGGDKATSKAMSAAYKYALLQTFCVPVAGQEDADRHSHSLQHAAVAPVEPVQGWEQWSRDILDMVAGCETIEAIDRVKAVYRPLLRALSAYRADLFGQIGEAIGVRRASISQPCSKSVGKPGPKRTRAAPKSRPEEVRAHA